MTRRFDLHKPVIAAVGGGFELMLACDLAVAVEQAVFSLPEPRVGLAATGGGGLQRLARELPWKLAVDIALAGRSLSATEAQACGLINAVVAPRDLLDTAFRYAQRIMQGAPLAVTASKAVMLAARESPTLTESLTREYPQLLAMLESEDAREGMQAFVEKRPPVWRGR